MDDHQLMPDKAYRQVTDVALMLESEDPGYLHLHDDISSMDKKCVYVHRAKARYMGVFA